MYGALELNTIKNDELSVFLFLLKQTLVHKGQKNEEKSPGSFQVRSESHPNSVHTDLDSSVQSSNYESARKGSESGADLPSKPFPDQVKFQAIHQSVAISDGVDFEAQTFLTGQRVAIAEWHIIASKVVFFKNFYLFPITVSLIQAASDLFIIRLSKYSTSQLKSNVRFFAVENLLGIIHQETMRVDGMLIREVRRAFREHNWEEFLVHLIVATEDSISFSPQIGYISYIEF